MTYKAGADYQKSHEYFVELCAISLSNELTESESETLQLHLRTCPSCQEALHQFKTIVKEMIPAVASDYVDDKMSENIERTTDEEAEALLLTRIFSESPLDQEPAAELHTASIAQFFPVPKNWRPIWAFPAAVIVLTVACTLIAYRVGVIQGASHAITAVRDLNDVKRDSRRLLQDQQINAQLVREDQALTELRQSLHSRNAEVNALKLVQDRLEKNLADTLSNNRDLVTANAGLAAELESTKSQMDGLQGALNSEQNRESQDRHEREELSAKLEDSTSLLAQRNKTIQEQDELLNHDRDIRELMGARDLYVVEVYDVEKNGKTRKPYGRMFYTKDKSVVFYAYDLDNQPGIQNASTFQAWGQSELNSQQPLNLGIFYVDNASKKRWVLKFDDPKVLAEINTVFVTVEPKGGSEKPTTKPFLFAYLHMDPNHP